MTNINEITQEQIDAWKKQFGDVFKVDIDGHIGYLKMPDRKTLSYANTIGDKDPLKFNEMVLNAAWLGGDEAIKTNDSLFISVGPALAQIIKAKDAELTKL